VFLDEPTTGLDPKARNRLWDYFRRINDRGTTVFLTTQYLEEADQLCDRISVIRDGVIVASGSPTELKSQVGGDVLDVSLGDPTDERLSRAREVVLEAGGLAADAVTTTDDGLSVTSPDARRLGTDLLVALSEAGFAVTGFNVRGPTLDDVFLAITDERLDRPDADAREARESDSAEAPR